METWQITGEWMALCVAHAHEESPGGWWHIEVDKPKRKKKRKRKCKSV